MTSLATSQNSLFDPTIKHPLFPVLTSGCRVSSNDLVQYP
jgi:threonine synthase